MARKKANKEFQFMRPVVGFPDYYITYQGDIWARKTKHWLIPYEHGPRKYLRATLRKENRTYKRYVHRLVLETFIAPCPEGLECRHLDGNAQNNNIANLCWGTRQENIADAMRHGTHTCLHQFGNQYRRTHGKYSKKRKPRSYEVADKQEEI